MNSRPLLDYMSDMDADGEEHERLAPGLDALALRLEELERRLQAPAGVHSLRYEAPEPAPARQHDLPDLNLSAQIEAILRRRELLGPGPAETARAPDRAEPAATSPRAARISVHAPPLADGAGDDTQSMSVDFLKFAEAVHLIGQAARRFIDLPDHGLMQPSPVQERVQPEPVRPQTSSPSNTREPARQENSEIATLTASLQEVISSFRSVADDLAVSAAEIRRAATQREPVQPRYERDTAPRYEREVRRPQRDDGELYRFQDDLEELQDRLGSMLRKRSGRY